VTCEMSLVVGTPVYSINKTDRHDINEILLKVALNTRTLSLQRMFALKRCIHTYGDAKQNCIQFRGKLLSSISHYLSGITSA
jgi:hypothetical protein